MSRILFWCDAFWPQIGGVEVLGARLVTALRDRGHEILVLTRRDDLKLSAEASFEGVPVRRLDFAQAAASRDAGRWLEVRRTVAQLKRGFAPEVVHVYHATFDSVFHLETRDAHPAPTLCTVHGAIPDRVLAPNSVLRRLLRDAEWTTACSVAALERIREQVPEIAVHSSVILNGLEAAHAAPPLPVEAPRLLCVGRLASTEKGFDLALSALARVAQRYPRLRLSIAGDGEERANLEQQAVTLGIADRVDFLGWVNPAEIPEWIAQSTIVVMPSRGEEGFGLAGLQAGQLERPVIATRLGGLAELIVDGETGLLIEPENVAALARAVATLLDDPRKAAAMGKAARRRALSVFGWDRHVDAYDELIRELAGRGAATSSWA
jgi:glycosyltransferase involved in cell wall biosynthesis